MRLSWFGDFFGALPDALRAAYQFGDPASAGRGWMGIVVTLIWLVPLTIVPLAIAKRTYGSRDWVSATMGVIGGLAIMWWVFGILPSAFLYYVDANRAILGDAIIPTSFAPWGIPIATNLYQVLRDLAVVTQHAVAFGFFFWAMLAVQKRYPRTLAPGEERRGSGGYK